MVLSVTERVLTLKDKSLFSKILLLILLVVLCIVTTIGIALLAGSSDTALFDFGNLNFGNLIPVLIIGCFISCIVIGIALLFVARSVFSKLRDYFEENNKNGGK